MVVPAADVRQPVATGPGNLGRDDHARAAATRFQPAADDGLGTPHGLGTWWHGIHLGRVDEVDPGIERHVELIERRLLRILFAEGHAAEAQRADCQPGVCKGAVLHRLHSRCHR